jgi:hypothetical protein
MCQEKERKKERKSFETHLLQDTSLPHLVSLFPVFPILALLIGRGVITQAPSTTSNNKTTLATTTLAKEIQEFKAKRNCRFQH